MFALTFWDGYGTIHLEAVILSFFVGCSIMKKHRVFRKKRLSLLLSVVILCLTLGSCGFVAGNDPDKVDAAVRSMEELYGIHLTVVKKNPLPGGFNCDVTAKCDELNGKTVHVFQFDDNNNVQCDYIFVKYEEEVLARIRNVASRALPEAKLVVNDSCYNHFANHSYDRNTTLADYLLHNDFEIHLILSEIHDEEWMTDTYFKVANACLDDGINCQLLAIYCMKTPEAAAAVKTYSCIPEEMEFRFIAEDKDIALRAENPIYCDLQQFMENKEEGTRLLVR